jgi:hypothetical protein
MLAGRYWFSDAFALGARGEYLKDRDGLLIPRATGLDLMSGTLTLEAKPTNNLIFKLDNRVDYGSKQIFQKSLREDTGYQITTTLGAVVTTD